MKQLILIRHGKSSWKYPHLDDIHRPLTSRGKTDSELVGTYLYNEHNVSADVILSSPAVRTRNTAVILAKSLQFDENMIHYIDALYSFGDNGDVILSQLQQLNDNVNTVVVVGHNDTCYLLANRLSGNMVEKFPTAATIGVKWNVMDWSQISEQSAEVLFHFHAKALRTKEIVQALNV